jgi:hypothetical protein
MAKGRQEGAGRSGAIFSSLQAPGPRRLGKRLVVFCGWGRAISTTPRLESDPESLFLVSLRSVSRLFSNEHFPQETPFRMDL